MLQNIFLENINPYVKGKSLFMGHPNYGDGGGGDKALPHSDGYNIQPSFEIYV